MSRVERGDRRSGPTSRATRMTWVRAGNGPYQITVSGPLGFAFLGMYFGKWDARETYTYTSDRLPLTPDGALREARRRERAKEQSGRGETLPEMVIRLGQERGDKERYGAIILGAMPPGADPEDEATIDAAIASLPPAEQAELDDGEVDAYHGVTPDGAQCHHRHRTPQAAAECTRRRHS
jgi:hypothetical protein